MHTVDRLRRRSAATKCKLMASIIHPKIASPAAHELLRWERAKPLCLTLLVFRAIILSDD